MLSDWALAPGPYDPALIEPIRATLSETYLNAYLAGSDLTRKEIEAWRLPVATGRLSEDIVEERELVFAQVAAFSP